MCEVCLQHLRFSASYQHFRRVRTVSTYPDSPPITDHADVSMVIGKITKRKTATSSALAFYNMVAPSDR
jgi:hypothetical protein